MTAICTRCLLEGMPCYGLTVIILVIVIRGRRNYYSMFSRTSSLSSCFLNKIVATYCIPVNCVLRLRSFNHASQLSTHCFMNYYYIVKVYDEQRMSFIIINWLTWKRRKLIKNNDFQTFDRVFSHKSLNEYQNQNSVEEYRLFMKKRSVLLLVCVNRLIIWFEYFDLRHLWQIRPWKGYDLVVCFSITRVVHPNLFVFSNVCNIMIWDGFAMSRNGGIKYCSHRLIGFETFESISFVSIVNFFLQRHFE